MGGVGSGLVVRWGVVAATAGLRGCVCRLRKREFGAMDDVRASSF